MRRETVWFPAAFFAHRKAMKRGLQQRAHTKGMQRFCSPLRRSRRKSLRLSESVPILGIGTDSFHAPKQVNMTAR